MHYMKLLMAEEQLIYLGMEQLTAIRIYLQDIMMLLLDHYLHL